MKYYLATCDSDGKCFGFLRTDRLISKDPDNEMDRLLSYKKKHDAEMEAMRINLGHTLLPDGPAYRVAVVRV